jgi:inosine/xanthosine triphosphatase
MFVVIGSTNKTKIQAVEQAFSGLSHVRVSGVEVKSGVSEQPMSDEETQNGAENRARAALAKMPKADLAIGLEGGVQKTKRGLLNSVWCCLLDRDDNAFFSNGERFYIPHIVADKILAGGEMGPILDDITGEKSVKTGRGFIGVMTKNYMTRAEAYGNLAKLAVGLWVGREWEHELSQGK